MYVHYVCTSHSMMVYICTYIHLCTEKIGTNLLFTSVYILGSKYLNADLYIMRILSCALLNNKIIKEENFR